MNNIVNRLKPVLLRAAILLLVFSCKKQNLYRDATYPDQVIYMPAAVNGIFLINTIPERIGNVPTPGMVYRYTIDLASKKFTVPLGVYRGGINTNGSASITIAANTDTISKMNTMGKFTGASAGAELLPAGKYSMNTSVELADGAELAAFQLNVDLDFLKLNPGKIYAIGVSISSAQIKPNPNLNTTIVVIDTRLLTPTAGFTTGIDAANKKVTYTNTSTFAASYSWDFGDGTTAAVDKSPSHVYTNLGTYTVTLTVKGAAGDISTATRTITI